jgi:signal transduction histidine kinase
MFKSFFRKHFIIYISALAVSFALLGFTMTTLFFQYFITQKERALETQGQKILSILLPLAYSRNDFFRQVQLNLLQNEMQNFRFYMETRCLLVNENLEVVIAPNDFAQYMGVPLDQPALAPVFRGETVSLRGDLGGIFPVPMLTVALPVEVEGQIYYGALLSTPLPQLEQTMLDVVLIMLICLVVCATLTFVFMFFYLRSFSKPLREMSDAARVIANGDFEKRIAVATRDEVGRLGESFNAMAESLFRQEELRRGFISNISHDLRSPLTSMRGFLQALLDGTAPEGKQGHYLAIILDETDRLAKLADDILDLNKIQSPEIALEISEFDVNELIRKTARMFEKRIVDKAIDLTLTFAEEANRVRADRDKILRVLYNLLDNAVKFSRPGGRIAVETTVADKKVLVSVKDTGLGIRPEDQQRVFDRFFKADASRGEDTKGSGLGLAIVRAFMIAHGETVTLRSGLGEGSEFVFSLQGAG